MAKGPGVVIGRSGSLGGAQFIPSDFWPLNTTLWVKDFKGNDPRFVYYLLKTIDFGQFNVGSGVPTLNRNHIHPLPIRCPRDISAQKIIAQILGSLDDKIELNRRVNETLEAMARAIFKSWFVDFDPVRRRQGYGGQVRAKMEGRQPAGMDAATVLSAEALSKVDALFPDSFQDSPLGEIPNGWRISKIGNEVNFEYGEPLKEENRIAGPYPVFGSNGIVGWHEKSLVRGPGIVIGRKGNPGTVTWITKDFYPIDTTFYVVPKKANWSMHYLYYALTLCDLPSLGADSAVPGLNRNMAYMTDILIPSRDAMSAFESVVSPIFQKIDLNMNQSKTLASIRDALLPKLMSGELSAKE